MRKFSKWWLGSAVLILALAACSAQIKPQATQADFDRSVQEYQADLGTVVAAAGQDLALQALGATPGGAPGLPTGALVANLMNLGAGPVSPADALKLLGGLAPSPTRTSSAASGTTTPPRPAGSWTRATPATT